ncbi:AAA family ATPase [Psychromonas hadalis]|uniref:AAA family ATPase n=1 Tax=Psychromonas hadalis TaxID=211669 RepID=UPI0003B45D2C|nr:AAA family ATPase [Psychromonas hadalis]
MYQAFFSLKAKPFSISPDPDFLFLSVRHKEAITHLQEGLQGHGGFALLTGEVGTGKTTICRSLVKDMSANTDIAFILNPAMNEVELLTTICESFNIHIQKNNLRQLFNELSNWLIKNHLQNRHAVVLIDEAQHLNFAALEQLRLLTNIESNDKKLLQVILIGQTELQEKLKQREFRQLAQRITARYHLLALTQQESSFYIQHRLNVAGSIHAIFDKSALQEIFKNCAGIPRLTNILCDRSLLIAYTQDSHIVTLKMVKQVSKEVNFNHYNNPRNFMATHWRLATLTILVAFTLLQAPQISKYIGADTLFNEVKNKFSSPITTAQLNKQWFDATPNLDLTHSTYEHALANLYAVWGYQVESSNANCEQGSAVLLHCYSKKIDLKKLKQLNYPSVVRLEKESNNALYAVVYKITDNYQLLINDQLISVTEAWFKTYWNGEATLLWKMPFPLKGAIKFGQQGKQVTWLANQLNREQGWPSEHKTRFDLRLLEQVSAFQREQGLMDDGMVGPRTLMPLMQLADPNSPRLLQEAN